MDYGGAFQGKRALITGGMGFTGSNLAIALVNAGAEVAIVDAMLPGYAGNLFNITPIRGRVAVHFCDVRDVKAMNDLVPAQDLCVSPGGTGGSYFELDQSLPRH